MPAPRIYRYLLRFSPRLIAYWAFHCCIALCMPGLAPWRARYQACLVCRLMPWTAPLFTTKKAVHDTVMTGVQDEC
ncbi:hypothetical protein EDWATA_00326 [Edwardsiella tarda ATCC 23685]|uniref:Uncharacterized protein n=1 Tax=Edwardsiella tarda ATCC 23685 TaxID=500638 RepID=D4F0U6_EDWTA|nr:hypothetical protein EDWATA_00326 [Edwardsiella tarda ATCC 23685]